MVTSCALLPFKTFIKYNTIVQRITTQVEQRLLSADGYLLRLERQRVTK